MVFNASHKHFILSWNIFNVNVVRGEGIGRIKCKLHGCFFEYDLFL